MFNKLRVAKMVIYNLFKIPIWLYNMDRLSRKDCMPMQEKYDYLRMIVKKVNKSGNVIIKTRGIENLPKQSGYILFPNHQGYFDSLALVEAHKREFGIVIKKEAVNYIVVKQVIALIKGIAIDRSDIKNAMEVIKRMTERVKQGSNFLIFAEGTRSKDGNNIGEMKAGAFKSAINALCPVVPVAIIDAFKPFDTQGLQKETVQVHFLKPIYPEEYKNCKSRDIAKMVYSRIRECMCE